jgi:hypothetical protein
MDGVWSAIRIVDRIISAPEVPSISTPMEPIHLRGWFFFIGLKAGDVTGRHFLSVKVAKPSGVELVPERQVAVVFGVGQSGSNIVIELDLDLDEEGIYWVELLYEGDLMTRSPLSVVYQPTVVSSGANQP